MDKPLDSAWIEDFLSLAKLRSFSAAASHRNLTLSSLSRHIGSLEDWIGAPLFSRNTHPAVLTPAGALFFPKAEAIVRELQAAHDLVNGASARHIDELRFACPQGLSVFFLPNWLDELNKQLATHIAVTVLEVSSQVSEQLLTAGRVQFAINLQHITSPLTLVPESFSSAKIATSRVIPVCVSRNGRPICELPGHREKPIPFLSYNKDDMTHGKISGVLAKTLLPKAHLSTVFSSQSVILLAAMVREGRGMAWLPEEAVSEDLASGVLSRAGNHDWDIEFDLRIFRARSPLSAAAEQLWSIITRAERIQFSEDG